MGQKRKEEAMQLLRGVAHREEQKGDRGENG